MRRSMIRSLVAVVCAVLSCVSLTVSTYAYAIWMNGGNKGTYIHFYAWSGFSKDTLTQFDKAFDEWNYKAYSAKPKSLWIDRSGNLTDQTVAFVNNDKNEITKGNRGASRYLMATNATSILYESDKYKLVEVDIDVNGSIPWANSVLKNYYFVQNAFTHEVGHVYGLDDVDADKYSESTMYYTASKNEDKKCTIEADDIAGIKAIYGGN